MAETYKKLTYDSKKIQVESAIRDGTGLEINSTYLKIQGGGTSKSYTISATGYKTIAQVSSASQYWTVNGGKSYIKCLITYSSLSTPANTATTTKLGTWIVDIAFSGINADITVTSENGNAGNANGVLRYLAAYAPKTTSYAPAIAVANYSSTSTYVTITILSCTPGWVLPASFGGDPGTTNYNRFGNWEVGRYNYTWSSNKIAANITGGCDGTAGWSNGTWDRIDNDRHKSGATVVWHNGTTSYSIVGTRFCGIGSDGLVYHIAKPGQVFALPFIGGRASTNYAANNTSVRLQYNIRGINTTELTNVNVANNADLSASTTYSGTGTAYAYNFVFSAPGATAVTTLTIGKPLYLCGNVDSNGNFVPYYTSATGQTVSVPKGQGGFAEATNVTMQKYTFYITQTPGYNEYYDTCLYIGKCDAANNVFTYMCSNARAYTYNSSGKLTHIDGRPIQDYTLAGLGGVPTSRTINGYNLTANRTLNGADVKITGYSKPDSTSALAATDTINAALGKLETALDGKQASGSYLTAHQTIKQDGVTGATANRYAICSSTASTVQKTATITTGTFTLEAGARVTVNFTNKNTATLPSLNINGTGNKQIYHNGSMLGVGTNISLLYGACDFVYDGTYWLLIGNYINSGGTVTKTGSSTSNQVALWYGTGNALKAVAQSAITAGACSGNSATATNAASTATTVANMQLRNIKISTSAPTSSDGADGDVWIQYTA